MTIGPCISRRVRDAAAPLLLAALLALSAAGPALAQYTFPSGHPRIFMNSTTVVSIADRCKVGGTHRAFYQWLKTWADLRIATANYDFYYLPNYALVYAIHHQWNLQGYQGGGFAEAPYWQAVRSGILNSGSWSPNEIGASSAIAADWIWEQLTPAQRSQIAGYYGAPTTNISPNGPVWNAGNSFNVATMTMRSTLFAGAGINDAGYNAEYQAIMGYLQNTYAPAYQLSGGVGPSGAGYEVESEFFRSWSFETMKSSTGFDPWPLCQNWASQYGKWWAWLRLPQHGYCEFQQDVNALMTVDDPRNLILLAARGGDSYGQKAANDYWTQIQNAEPNEWRTMNLWCLLLWYDTSLAPYNTATAPLAVRLGSGGMDHIYMRSSWTDPNYTWAEFEAGKYFWGHQHYDAGTFLISRKGFLALDSGFYAQYSAANGQDHGLNYYRRSIAHNTMSVYDPIEQFFEATGTNFPMVNDGGEHVPRSDPSLIDLQTKAEFSTGQMLRYETSASYTYGQADLAGAYNSAAVYQRRGLPPYTNKITNYTREFIYLRPDFFVCIDRLTAKSASLSKVWNLHVAGNPTVTGTGVQRAGDATAGIWEYAGADEFKVVDSNPAFQQGGMFVKSLLPKNRVIRKIGGRNRDPSGFAYWAGGINGSGRYDPTLGGNHYWGNWNSGYEFQEGNVWANPIGWGRVEVQPTVDAATDQFLHVLYPCDGSVTSMPQTRLLESPNAVGAEIVNRRVILFGRTEVAALDSLTYTVAANDTAAKHMIVDLSPGQTYRVYRQAATFYVRRNGIPAPAGATEIVTPPAIATAAGVIEYNHSGGSGTPGPTTVLITNVQHSVTASPFSVTITWQTDLPSDSRVEYGTTPSYGQSTPLQTAEVTSHSVTIASPPIQNDVLYHYRVLSNTSGGATGVSTDRTFQADVIAPNAVTDLRTR